MDLRPNITFVVSKLSRYTSNPSRYHWKAIGRLLGYLKRSSRLALFYSKFLVVLEGYTDASWIITAGDNKSTSGWIFTLGGSAVSWASKKQTCISHSTMESKVIALATAGKEAEATKYVFRYRVVAITNVSHFFALQQSSYVG